jgi:glycerol kinase
VSVCLAIDAGTTGVRAFAVDDHGRPLAWSYREFPQHFPQPGWVEHDPEEIWAATVETLAETEAKLSAEGASVTTIGITNQRETAVVWDRRTGRPLHRAIVWQDRRTAGRCDELRAAGKEPLVRERTGLVLDPYFSRRGRSRSRVRHRRQLDPVAPHGRAARRRARDRPVEREPHAPLRHRRP